MNNNINTQWAVIAEFPNYKISTDSEVVNMVSGKNVSISLHKHGFRVVRLWKNNTTKLMKIYRLKALCFIPNPENKKEVNHIDGNRMNEDLSNLEWATPSENMVHAFNTGLTKGNFKRGAEHVFRKLSIEDIVQIRELRRNGKKLKEIGSIFGITMDHVCRVSRHKQTIEI
jgi:hypothetical protein